MINNIYYFSLLKLIYRFIDGLLIKLNNFIVLFKAFFLHFFSFFFSLTNIFSLNSLVDLFAIDYPYLYNKRFCLNYSFWSYKYVVRFFFKTFTSGILPIFSLMFFYSSACWLEREVWDLFGLKFFFNTNLRRILLDYGFQGHPLRKEFPLIGYIEVRYEDSVSAVVVEPVEMMQIMRTFFFKNSWTNTSSK